MNLKRAKKMTDEVSAWWSGVPTWMQYVARVCSAVGVIGGVLLMTAKLLFAQLAIPDTVRMQGEAIKINAANIAELQRNDSAQARDISQVLCFIKAQANVDGKTVQGCALRNEREP